MKAKNVWMIFVIIAMAVMFFTGCPGVVGPDPPPPPPPPPEKTYTLRIQYTRTFLNPDLNTKTISLYLYDLSLNYYSTGLYAVDDYHFNGELPGVKVRADYYFHCYDIGRYDGSDGSSCMVGDIFIVTVKETGFVKELKDIRPYNLSTNLHPGPKAKAAFFQLTSDGTIISNLQ